LLAGREHAGHRVGTIGQANILQCLVDPLTERRAGETEVLRPKGHLLPDAPGDDRLRRILEDERDTPGRELARRNARRVAPEDPYLTGQLAPRKLWDDAGEDSEERGLAAPARPAEQDQLARPDSEVDAIERGARRVRIAEPEPVDRRERLGPVAQRSPARRSARSAT